MSSINVGNLIKIMLEKISASTNERDLLYYSKVVEVLKSGKIFTVNNELDLPSAISNPGSLYYVISSNTMYISRPGSNTWFMLSKENRSIYSWGLNSCGVLGTGTTLNACSPVREFCSATDWCQVVLGAENAAGVKYSGELWTWGNGTCGQLGDGTTVCKCSPVREFCSATDWCQVSGGYRMLGAIKTNGTLWAWGVNSDGQLGDGTTVDKCSPVREISYSGNWCQISAGFNHMGSIKNDGTLWAWGNNSVGKIGDCTTSSRCSPVREFCSRTAWCQLSFGNCHSVAIDTSNGLWTWGSGSCGALARATGVPSQLLRIPCRECSFSSDWCAASASCLFTTAIKNNGTLWAWGKNNQGQLGDGTKLNSSVPTREVSSSTDWCLVSSAINSDHSSAIKTDGTLWSWGCATYGRLGDGTVTSKCSPVQEVTCSSNWIDATVGSKWSAAISF